MINLAAKYDTEGFDFAKYMGSIHNNFELSLIICAIYCKIFRIMIFTNWNKIYKLRQNLQVGPKFTSCNKIYKLEQFSDCNKIY